MLVVSQHQGAGGHIPELGEVGQTSIAQGPRPGLAALGRIGAVHLQGVVGLEQGFAELPGQVAAQGQSRRMDRIGIRHVHLLGQYHFQGQHQGLRHQSRIPTRFEGGGEQVPDGFGIRGWDPVLRSPRVPAQYLHPAQQDAHGQPLTRFPAIERIRIEGHQVGEIGLRVGIVEHYRR